MRFINSLKAMTEQATQYIGVFFLVALFLATTPFIAYAADHTITASAGVGGSLTPSGAVTVVDGADQSFSINPDLGYHVADVLVDTLSVGALTSFTFTGVVADHTIDATFAIDQFTITASAGSNGSIAPSGASIVDYGTDQTFTITPAVGYEVATLAIDGATTSTSTSYTFTGVTTDHTIDVTFSALAQHTVTVIGTLAGNVTPSGIISVYEGDSLTIAITPDVGYAVGLLIVDSLFETATTSYTFTNIVGDHTLTAVFMQSYDIVSSAGLGGSITASGTTTVLDGDDVTYTITSDTGYGISTLTIDGVTTTPTTTVTFAAVSTSHTIHVAFAPLHTIVVTGGGNGTVVPTGTTTVTEGADFSVTITPDTGYTIGAVTVDGSPVATSTTHTLTGVVTDHTIAVTFIPVHTIVVTGNSNGTVVPSGTSTITDGADFSVTITPDLGYTIGTVIVDGATTTPTTTVTFTNVTAPHTIDVVFIALHTITTISGTNGTVTPSGVSNVPNGSEFTVTITPDLGYAVATLVVDSMSVATATSYTFTNIVGDHTISATFVPVYTITATAGVNGTITPSGTTVVIEGSNQSLTITPDTGYGISTLTIDGVTTTPTTTVTFMNVTASHTVDVVFVPTHTITTTIGANGTMTPNGTNIVLEGSTVTYTITPNLGYGVNVLLVDGVTTTPTTTITFTNVTSDHTIDVTFRTLPIYTILATAGANGNISPVGSTTVTEGNNQTFTFTPAPGYGVATLTVDGTTTPVANTYTFVNVQGDRTIDVTFYLLPTHSIHATAGANGTISPAGTTTVIEGTNQMFFITPAPGYGISTTTVDGVVVPNTNIYTFVNVVGDRTIDVTFYALPIHTITATAGTNGAVSPSGATAVYEGSNQTFTFTPAYGYTVGTLTVDSLPVATGTSYTFTNVTGNHTLAVTFVLLPTHTLTATAGTNGTITSSGITTLPEGYTQTYTITPDVGYGIGTLIVDGVTTTPTTTVTFTNVTSNHTIDVTFVALSSHTIVASAGLNGTISPVGTSTVFNTYNQTYTITPDYGYGIATLLIDSLSVPTTTSYTFTNVTVDHTISATFVLLPTYTITLTPSSNGTIVGSSTVVEGNTQTYTIVPDFGYGIGALIIDGVTTTPTTTVTLTNVISGHTIDVTFVPLPIHTITATAGVNGVVSPSGAVSVYETYSQSFTITPNTGYVISTLVVDGVPVTAVTTYTFTNVMTDHTISATFVQVSGSSHSGSGGGSKTKKTKTNVATSTAEIVDEKRSLDLENILNVRGVQVSGIPSGVDSEDVGTTSSEVSTTSSDIFGNIADDVEENEVQNEANILSAIQRIPGLIEVLIMILILSLIGGFFLRRNRR